MQLLCRTRNKDRRTCERSKVQMDEENITNETDEQGQMQKLSQELLGSTQTTTPVSRWMDTFFMYKPLPKHDPYTAIVVDTLPNPRSGDCCFRLDLDTDQNRISPDVVSTSRKGKAHGPKPKLGDRGTGQAFSLVSELSAHEHNPLSLN